MLVLARFAGEFRGFATCAPASTKPPCYAGYQRDSLWLARMNLATDSCRILWDFNFLRRLAPGCLDGFSIGRYEEKRESFYPFATGFESGAMRFWGKKLLRHWSSFRTWIPPFHPCPSIIRNGQRAFTPGRRAQNASSEWNGQKSNIIVNL